jgi:hypothetical protein
MKNYNGDLKTRKEKIQFLTDLKNGRASIAEILPIKISMWKMEDGKYINMKTGEAVSPEEYEAQSKGCKTITLELGELQGLRNKT